MPIRQKKPIGRLFCWAAVSTGLGILRFSLVCVPSVAFVGKEVGNADVGGSTQAACTGQGFHATNVTMSSLACISPWGW